MQRPHSRPLSRPVSRRLDRAQGNGVWLAYYPPGTVQPRHDHGRSQLSLLLSGCFAESSGGREFQPLGRQIGLMPAGESHEVRFGREGALMLSVDCAADAQPGVERRTWRRLGTDAARRTALLHLVPDHASDLAGELVASFGDAEDEETCSFSAAPGWLRKSVTQLADDPDTPIAMLAQEAGVHRVYFSRRFQQCFGISPTEFRLLRKSAAAMRRTIDGEIGLAEAALEAGFADQAHWSRTCRALAGIPPAKIRRLFAY